MSTPAQHIADAILLASVGRDGWAIAAGCEQGCCCSVCFELNRGLDKLNTALEEMKAAE